MWYLIAGILWGLYAFKKQMQRTPYDMTKNILTALVNGLCWPITMSIAVFSPNA